MGTVCFIEKKETNQSECVQRQNKRIKSRADSRTSQSHPHRHCMGTTATSINGHSGTRCWARFPQRNISKGGLGSLPSAFRSLQLLCAIRTKLRLSNYVVKCFDLNASLLVLIITSLKGESFTLPRARTRLTSLPKPLHRWENTQLESVPQKRALQCNVYHCNLLLFLIEIYSKLTITLWKKNV